LRKRSMTLTTPPTGRLMKKPKMNHHCCPQIFAQALTPSPCCVLGESTPYQRPTYDAQLGDCIKLAISSQKTTAGFGVHASEIYSSVDCAPLLVIKTTCDKPRRII
jgi:hypothetical protein